MTKPRKTRTAKPSPAQPAPAAITLSAWRDIPLDKLVLAQTNVRRLEAGLSIEELAEDIARRTLLQSLSVRPVLDEAGAETGRSTTTAPLPPCTNRASARRRSRPASSSPRRSCASASSSPRRARSFSISTSQTS